MIKRFGLESEKPRLVNLNYAGVGLSCVSAFFFVLIKPETIKSSPMTSLVRPAEQNDAEAKNSKIENYDFIERLSPMRKKVLGVSMAVIAGLFYGECFTPLIYAAERDGHRPYVEYVFSYYTGILLTSSVYFVVYCLVKKNEPVINNRLVLPACACGVLWAAGNVCQTIGTSKLSQAVSFPIANSGPAIVSTLWAVFLFKEIKGKRNFTLLSAGFAMTIAGSVLSGVSF